MDSLRGQFSGFGTDSGDESEYADDYTAIEAPPSPVGQDERRMQVRAYNFWAGLLDNRSFPSIEDLDPENLPDFGPHSVLLDFSAGVENPAVQFLGKRLAEECAGEGPIRHLDDVPSRSLLSRITDHYMQILANQAPIGFEAEFVNQRGATVLYRGILLPFSSDDDTIDFIYGVINWKELADQATTDELLLEVEQALEEKPAPAAPELVAPEIVTPEPADAEMVDWADGPTNDEPGDAPADAGVLDLALPLNDGLDDAAAIDWPAPAFGRIDAGYADLDDAAMPAPAFAALDGGLLENGAHELAAPGFAADLDGADLELADWLASARELAQAAKGSEDRSRQALYAAIGRAYDFSLAAADAPHDFDEIVAESGLTMQDRAPMTPVVKLVFGAEYDKTRLTEYASALSHAHRIGLPRGALAGFLITAPGGLKGVVATERRLKREESGKAADHRETPREALARKLRELEHSALADISPDGQEFTLLVARRLPDGRIVLLGEVDDDVALLERAARRLLA